MSTQLRQQQPQRVAIAGQREIAVDGVEEPERRVGRVIEARVLAFREHIRDEAVAHVVGERAQDAAGLGGAPVTSVSPSRLIIVSRPQSVNQW